MNSHQPRNVASPSRSWTRPHRAAGFTLIELMVTVAIVAILAAIAYPSYRNYVLRGQLVNATNGLSALQANMERYYQDNRSYVSGTNGFPSPCAAAANNGTFTLSCSATPAASSTSYQIQAVGSGPTAAFTYYVNQANTQWTIVGAGAPSGWNTCMTGWVTKAAAAC